VGAFLHAYESERRHPRGSFAEPIDIKANAVVLHDEKQDVGIPRESQQNLRCLRVTHHIGQRFLRDTETGCFELARETFILIGQIDNYVDIQAGTFRVTIDVPTKRSR